MNRTKVNYIVDMGLMLLFLVVAFAGFYMYFFIPSGVPHGRYVVYMGLTKATWTWIHNKSAILMTFLLILHLALHWKWIFCITGNLFKKEKKKQESCDRDEKKFPEQTH